MLPSIQSPGKVPNKSSISKYRGQQNPSEERSFHVFMRKKSPEFVEKEIELLSAIRALPNQNQHNLLLSLQRLENRVIGNSPTNYNSSNHNYNDDNNNYDDNNGFNNFNDFNGRKQLKQSKISKVRGDTVDLRKYGTVLEDSSMQPSKSKIRVSLIMVGKALEDAGNGQIHGLTATGREDEEVIGLTALRALLIIKLKMNLTSKQTEALMIYFDHENRGEINLNDLFGSAQLYYDKWKRKQEDKVIVERVQVMKLERKAQRLEYTIKLNDARIRAVETLGNVMNILREASYNLILSKKVRLIQSDRRLIMNTTLFQEYLTDFDIHLSTKERKVLEERYCHDRPGTVDSVQFKKEFISLGAELLIQNGRTDALDAFLAAMCGTLTDSTVRDNLVVHSDSTIATNSSIASSTVASSTIGTRATSVGTGAVGYGAGYRKRSLNSGASINSGASLNGASSCGASLSMPASRGRDTDNRHHHIKDTDSGQNSGQKDTDRHTPNRSHNRSQNRSRSLESSLNSSPKGSSRGRPIGKKPPRPLAPQHLGHSLGSAGEALDNFYSDYIVSKSADQVKLDKFMVLFNSGGRVQSPGYTPGMGYCGIGPVASIAASSASLQSMDCGSSVGTGVGNTIWYYDKKKEYTFMSRTPKGKKVPLGESQISNTSSTFFAHIPAEEAPVVEDLMSTKKYFDISVNENQMKLDAMMKIVGRRNLEIDLASDSLSTSESMVKGHGSLGSCEVRYSFYRMSPDGKSIGGKSDDEGNESSTRIETKSPKSRGSQRSPHSGKGNHLPRYAEGTEERGGRGEREEDEASDHPYDDRDLDEDSIRGGDGYDTETGTEVGTETGTNDDEYTENNENENNSDIGEGDSENGPDSGMDPRFLSTGTVSHEVETAKEMIGEIITAYRKRSSGELVDPVLYSESGGTSGESVVSTGAEGVREGVREDMKDDVVAMMVQEEGEGGDIEDRVGVNAVNR